MAVFGGTFNPIHLGHLRAAEEVREQLGLDRVYFVPSFIPPHKERFDVVPASHRLRMVELAVEANPFFSASNVELERGGLSFSVDTIRHFQGRLAPQALYFVMGADAFREIHTWKDYPLIFALCHVAVISRPGARSTSLARLVPVELRGEFCYDTAVRGYMHTSGNTLRFTPVTKLDISASAIRGRLRRGRSIRYLVPREVEEYIGAHGLYRDGEPRGAQEEDAGSR